MKEVSIDEISHIVTKGTTPTTYGMPFTDEGVNFIKAEALNGDASLDYNGFSFISEGTHEKLARSQLCVDDILITIAGANIGKCGLVGEGDLPANTNQAVGLIRVDAEIANPKYVYYHFKNPATFNGLQGLGGQAAQPNINLTTLKNQKLKLPDSSMQVRVVNILSSYDELIRNNSRQIKLLNDAAYLLYREWFVYMRFPGHEHKLISGGMPDGWTKEPLENLLVLQRGFDLPFDRRVDGVVPIIASTGVNGFHNEAKVSAPGVVTGRSGSLGTVMYVSKNFWPLNTTLWVKEFKKASPIFSTFLLRSMSLQNYNGGAAVPTLNRNDIHKVEVVCPDAKTMGAFDQCVKPIFAQIEHLEEFSKKLSLARDLLLPRLMNGDIAV